MAISSVAKIRHPFSNGNCYVTILILFVAYAPIAQLDRASVYGTEGFWFEPR